VGIGVQEGAAAAIAASPGRFALQVTGADDVPAALAALRLLRTELVGLSGRGKRPEGDTGRDAVAAVHADVSQAVAAPAGPLVLVQHLEADPGELAQIPELVADRLAEAGVSQALVTVPPLGGPLDALDAAPGCVVLRLFPAPDGNVSIPPDWLDVAVEWVVGDLDDADPVAARILSVEHTVAARDVADVLHDCGLARAWCDLVNGDPDERVRTASLTYGRLPHLALAAGGPTVDGPGLIARFDLLRDVARELAADVAYACLDIEPTFEGLALGLPVDGWRARGGASPNRVAAVAADVVVPDAFPWQVLGPGHLDRLAELGEQPPPYDALGDGHVEVALGDPADWLPRSPARVDAQDDAIAWLSPLLVDPEELVALESAVPLPGHQRAAAPSTAAASPFATAPPLADAGVPDLDAVVLRATSTARRSTRLSPLELAAWFAHEPHTDQPTAVSPVVASFVRWWAAGLDDDTRQRLKPFVPRLVGTSGDPALDRARRWVAIDWLVRRQATAWLRLAGLVEGAERLAAIGPLTDERELATAVEVLGTATTVAGRRIDITASIVAGDDHDDPDDALAWETWESVNESSAWVAASEAATHGTPGEVAYATDLRVIEVSRDARARDAVEATGTPVGATAWSTALHALADEAWEQAWRAADRAARDLSGLTIRVEMGRVAKTTLARMEELPELALEQAEATAKQVLVRAALRNGEPDRDGEHPWDAARNAARSSPGGATWSVVVDESRRAVGESAWAQSMAEARAVVDGVLLDAPDIVARSVVAAVAREACSAAARGVAYRAAAVARAHGADDLGAEQAAHASLAACAHELQEAAFELLTRLIDPR
jgi:hypothetical protein